MPNATEPAQTNDAAGTATAVEPPPAPAPEHPPKHDTTAAAPPTAPEWALRQPSDFPGGTRNVVGRRPTTVATHRAAVAMPPAPSLGPAGKRRSPLLVALLSVVTLGVYALIWHQRVNTEMRDFDPRMHVRPGRSTVAVTIPWVLGLLVTLAGAARIVLDQLHVALPFDPHFTVMQGYYLLAGLAIVPYLVLVLACSAVAVTMTLERVRIVEERVGRTTNVQVRPARAVWWLLLPFSGGLVLLHLMQRRLNAVWQAAEPPTTARISQY